VLFLSDVPGDDPGVIGSGLAAATPGESGDRLSRVVVASLDAALEAAQQRAAALGLSVERLARRIEGQAELEGREFVRALRTARCEVLLAGGESVVTLPERCGRGGRNQHLALAAALELAPHEDLALLAAGTDGDDGPSGDAGALIDGGTCARIGAAGLDAREALRAADSGTALEAASDLLHTGPTGTNVGDLVIGLRAATTRAAQCLASHGEPAVPVL
jgi:hydroxypyruvate reductase